MAVAISTSDIKALYTEALEHSSVRGGERALRGAYEVGRLALTSEVGLLDMAELHHVALSKILTDNLGQGAAPVGLADASQFLAESLSAYEMAYRGYRDAVAGLRCVNEALEQEVRRIAHAVHDERASCSWSCTSQWRRSHGTCRLLRRRRSTTSRVFCTRLRNSCVSCPTDCGLRFWMT